MWNYIFTFFLHYTSHPSEYAMRDGVEHPTSFVEESRKRRGSIELSNNISERRCELKANEPVNEHGQ